MKNKPAFEASNELTERLRAAVARWSLRNPAPMAETATSWVFRVTSRDAPRVLKLLKPYGSDEIKGAHLMRWWAGEGAARIDAIEGDDILMAWLEGGTLGDLLRADWTRDAEATDILCEVIEKLHRPRAEPPPLLWPLDGWMKPLARSDLTFLPVGARQAWLRAQAILAALLSSTTEHGPLHGDLHHDNVIGSSGTWRAIDPKGLVGDPTFDVANIFRNPYGGGEMVFQPDRIDGLAARFSSRFGWDRRRIVEWACVLTAISAVWNKDSSFEWELRMLPMLLAARDRHV